MDLSQEIQDYIATMHNVIVDGCYYNIDDTELGWQLVPDTWIAEAVEAGCNPDL